MALFNRFKGITFKRMRDLSGEEVGAVVEKCPRGDISLRDGRLPFLRGVVAFRGSEPVVWSGMRTEHIESGQFAFNHRIIGPRNAMKLVSECTRQIDSERLGGKLRLPRKSKSLASRIFRRRIRRR